MRAPNRTHKHSTELRINNGNVCRPSHTHLVATENTETIHNTFSIDSKERSILVVDKNSFCESELILIEQSLTGTKEMNYIYELNVSEYNKKIEVICNLGRYAEGHKVCKPFTKAQYDRNLITCDNRTREYFPDLPCDKDSHKFKELTRLNKNLLNISQKQNVMSPNESKQNVQKTDRINSNLNVKQIFCNYERNLIDCLANRKEPCRSGNINNVRLMNSGG